VFGIGRRHQNLRTLIYPEPLRGVRLKVAQAVALALEVSAAQVGLEVLEEQEAVLVELEVG